MEVAEQTEQKPKKNGGARPNSGPKLGAKYKKTLERQVAASRLTQKIEERIDEIAEVLIDKALTGDIPAIKEAFERGLGKVLERKHVEYREQKPFDDEPQDNRIQADKEPQ